MFVPSHDVVKVKLLLLLCLFVFCCLPLRAQQGNSRVTHSFFLVGDAGEPYIPNMTLGKVLRQQVAQAGTPATVLYLGDNIYPDGLPAPGSASRQRGEMILQTQVDWIKGLDAKGIFIPGNHDWQHWGRKGLQYIGYQQQWIDSLKDENFTLIPQQGCPGPVEIAVNGELLLVIIDTQWFLHQWNKPGEDGPCEAKTTGEVLSLLADIFERNHDKRIVVAAHHPLITYGEHGGVFTWKNHLFPLTDINPGLYVPMPVVGSLYPLYRKFFGHIQDTANPVYKEFGQAIQDLLKEYPGSIYVAGHEHALEYIVKDSTHYVVSGAGAKTTYVKKKKYAAFAEDVTGFAKLLAYDNGEASLHFFEVDNETPQGREIFSARIPASYRLKRAATQSVPDLSDKFVTVSASSQYKAGSLRKRMLGENYRREWATPLQVPVFDIGSEKGGLKILQKGGGQQTLSLRLEDSTGHEYVIRSVEKYPEKAVPEMLRKTFAQDLVQDQISASHPYAALVIGALADAAGIYHTNPKLVYIPDDPRLGSYQKTFSNMLALFEERPAGDWSEAGYFGNSEKIVNTSKVIEKTTGDNDNTVDQEFVLRSRLFDLVIGDWDRHDDQWRWATLGGKKASVFRPIPRDRDQAFFINEGRIAKLWSRRWALPKLEGFDSDVDWAPGLSFNARYFDRTFLTALSKEQWVSTAKALQAVLTDEAIEHAIRQWPEPIYNLHGPSIISDLKHRRDKLDQYAVSLYEFLAREVEVTGSDKRERFEVDRLPGGNVRVKVFKVTKEGEPGKMLYDRLFKKHETREVRLYGLGGDDDFIITGAPHRKAVTLRIIGGEGNDKLADSAKASGNARAFLYDQTGQFKLSPGTRVKDMTSDAPEVNTYDRMSFRYNLFAPLLFGNYNPDDGLFIGGGFLNIAHGFRKQPFKQRHIFMASIAPLTQSFNFRYQGKFTEVVGKWNFEMDVNLRSPNYVNNFFGMGNESIYNDDIEDAPGIDVKNSINYYRYRFEELRIEPALSRNFGSASFKIGPAFQRIEMEEPGTSQDRFIEEYASTLEYDLFDEYNIYTGGAWELAIDKRNDRRFTRRGLLWTTTGRSMAGLDKHASTFSSFESVLSFYHSFRALSRMTFAVRIGGGVNTGNYEFYQAQVLDGKTELRGFRKTRFYGDSKLYSNLEVRMRLLSFRTYLFPASLGILGFHDLGRVWYKNDAGIDPSAPDGKSQVWHKGWGGGIWFTPFNMGVLSTEVGASKEGALFYVRLGFLF